MEHAELNFDKGSAKQMNIIMDLWGLGLMRMPPMEILSCIGTIMNRDYAGKLQGLPYADYNIDLIEMKQVVWSIQPRVMAGKN